MLLLYSIFRLSVAKVLDYITMYHIPAKTLLGLKMVLNEILYFRVKFDLKKSSTSKAYKIYIHFKIVENFTRSHFF